MPVMQTPVCIEEFSVLPIGSLFVLVKKLGYANKPAEIMRKIRPQSGFNCLIENWEGEACNQGMETIPNDADVIVLC